MRTWFTMYFIFFLQSNIPLTKQCPRGFKLKSVKYLKEEIGKNNRKDLDIQRAPQFKGHKI